MRKLYKVLIAAAVIILIIYVVTVNYSQLIDLIGNLVNGCKKCEFSLALFTAWGALATTFIAIIACVQIKGLKKTADGDFLLRIDDSFRDVKIQNALYLIFSLELSCKSSCSIHHEKRYLGCVKCNKVLIADIQKRLITIYLSSKKENRRKRYDLKIYLDHLETLSYFVNKGYIDFKDIKGLDGAFIRYHYLLFKKWIELEKKDGDPTAYSELKDLAFRLEKTENGNNEPPI